MPSLEQLLREYETCLMDPAVRRSEKAADLLADDFTEFGSNGRMYNKADALAIMRRHVVRYLNIEDFSVRELGPGLVLVTYRVRSQGFGGSPGRVSMRSSIWVQRNSRWQVTYHQATVIGSVQEPSQT